jgi:hypothetical protein
MYPPGVLIPPGPHITKKDQLALIFFKLAEGEGLLRPSALSLRENPLRGSRYLTSFGDQTPSGGSSSSRPARNKKNPMVLSFSPLAEGEGVKTPVPCGTPVFKTGSFNHSDTPPKMSTHYRGLPHMVSSRHFDNFAVKVHNGLK